MIFLYYILFKKRGKKKTATETDLEERSKRKPHLDVLHLLQSKVRDWGFFGFSCWRDVTEEFGEEQALWTGRHSHLKAARRKDSLAFRKSSKRSVFHFYWPAVNLDRQLIAARFLARSFFFWHTFHARTICEYFHIPAVWLKRKAEPCTCL